MTPYQCEPSVGCSAGRTTLGRRSSRVMPASCPFDRLIAPMRSIAIGLLFAACEGTVSLGGDDAGPRRDTGMETPFDAGPCTATDLASAFSAVPIEGQPFEGINLHAAPTPGGDVVVARAS